MIAFRHLINNEYEEGYKKFCEMSDTSLYHLVGKLTVLTALDLTSFKKHRVLKTLQEIKKGYRLLSEHRKKRSATSAVAGLFRNVYNDYQDREFVGLRLLPCVRDTPSVVTAAAASAAASSEHHHF